MPTINESTVREQATKKGVPYEELAAEGRRRGYTIIPTAPSSRMPSSQAGMSAMDVLVGPSTASEDMGDMSGSVMLKQLNSERDALVEAEARSKIEKAKGFSKFAYSIGIPPTNAYASAHPFTSSLGVALSPFTAMARGVSAIGASMAKPDEKLVQQQIQSMKNNPNDNIKYVLTSNIPEKRKDEILRGMAINTLRSEVVGKAITGETTGAVELAAAAGRGGMPVGVATGLGIASSVFEEAPYWLSLPPYTQAFGAAVKGTGVVLKPMAKGMMALTEKIPAAGKLIDRAQATYITAANMPVSEATGKIISKIGKYDVGQIAESQMTPIAKMSRERIASGIDDVIMAKKDEISREYMRALRAGDMDTVEYLSREMDSVGKIPEDLLAREAMREGTTMGMVSESAVKKASKELRTGTGLTKVDESGVKVIPKPEINVPDVSLSEAEATLIRSQIDDLNRVAPTMRGKAKEAMLRRRTVLENKLENSRMDIFENPYKPPAITEEPILKQAREDLRRTNSQFNLSRGAKEGADPLYGFAQRELTDAEEASLHRASTEKLSPQDELFTKKLWNEVVDGVRSPNYKIRDQVWRPMKWAEESERNLSISGRSTFEREVGVPIDEFSAGGKFEESGKKLFKLAEYMRSKKMGREITPSIVKQFGLTETEVSAFNSMQGGYKYMREMINTQYPGALPQELDEIAYVTRLMPTKSFVTALETQKNNLEAMLSKTTDSIEDRVNLNKQVKLIDKIVNNYKQGKPVSYKTLPKSVKANFLEQRILPEALLEMNAADNYLYYMRVAGRKLYTEPTLKHINQMIPTIADARERKYTADIARKWAGLDYTDSAIDNLSKGVVNATNFFMLTSPHQFFMNTAQIVNSVCDVGPIYTTKAVMHTASQSPKFMEYWNRSMYKNDVDGIIRDFTGKLGRKVEESIVYPMQLAEPGLRKTSGFAGYLQAELEYSMNLKTPAAEFVKDKVAKGFNPKDAFAAWGDRALERNQFVYGVLGLSKAQQSTIGKVGLLYTSYSTKMLELMADWAKNNPQKLFAFLALTYGIKEFGRNVGVDMANYIGTGVDEKRMIEGIMELGKGTDKETESHFNYALKDSGTQQVYDETIGKIGEGLGILPGRLWGGTAIFQNLKNYQKAMPVGIDRLLTTYKALSDGKKEYPLVHITEEMRQKMMSLTPDQIDTFQKEGYPWRNLKSYHSAMKPGYAQTGEAKPEGEITKVYTDKEMLIRNVLGTPVYDGEVRAENRRTQLLKRATDEAKAQMQKAAYSGNNKAMMQWYVKYEGLGGDGGEVIKDLYYKGFIPRETYNWTQRRSSQRKKEELKMMKTKLRILESQAAETPEP